MEAPILGETESEVISRDLTLSKPKSAAALGAAAFASRNGKLGSGSCTLLY